MDFEMIAIPPAERVALFLDVDGTLIDIAPQPENVIVPADLASIMVAASNRAGGALAVLSGRTIAEIDRLLAPARLRASGIHGAEFRANPDQLPESTGPLPAAIATRIQHALAEFPGTLFEDKGPTLAVHFRAVPGCESSLRAALTRCLATVEPALDLMTGDKVFEVKPRGFDKGAALRRFMTLAPFASRTPIFVSDHSIDEAGFAAAVAFGGLAFSVGARLPGTSFTFAGPPQVRAWLREFGT